MATTPFLALAQAAAAACRDIIGEAITYTESGGSAKSIRAIVQFDVEYRNENGELVGRFVSAQVAKADLTNPIGASLVIRGVTYTVAVPSARVPLATDGVMARLLAK